MKINISNLIEQLISYKCRVQKKLTPHDDLMLAVVLSVLEEVKKSEEVKSWNYYYIVQKEKIN